MNKIITYENLRSFAYSNDKLIKGKIKGVAIDFFGLGGQAMYKDDTDTGKRLAENNILFFVPYANPWGWMNRQEINLTDEIMDVLFEHYSLDENTPIVSTGGSMGGLCSLVYSYYAKRTPVACVSNCPVCDLVYHFTEREDLPRTIYSAFCNEEGELNEVLAKYSPFHLAPSMPKIKYTLFHCSKDGAVNIEKHSEKFVNEMKKNGHDIIFHIVPDRGHCDLGEEASALYYQTIIDCINGK
ncbi:MAG: prolyl oligopeptidase family serine peptidase [Clostridia bacterium]|nr:prolyl oligopeptidase family serine peptidase [Clostridia bacterium]